MLPLGLGTLFYTKLISSVHKKTRVYVCNYFLSLNISSFSSEKINYTIIRAKEHGEIIWCVSQLPEKSHLRNLIKKKSVYQVTFLDSLNQLYLPNPHMSQKILWFHFSVQINDVTFCICVTFSLYIQLLMAFLCNLNKALIKMWKYLWDRLYSYLDTGPVVVLPDQDQMTYQN